MGRPRSPRAPGSLAAAIALLALLAAAGCARPLGAWFEGEEPEPEPEPEPILREPIWPFLGGGPGRTGQSPHRGPRLGALTSIALVPPADPDEPPMTHTLPGAIDPDGLVYAVARSDNDSGWVFAIDQALQPFWAYRPPVGSVTGLPALTPQGRLVLESRDETRFGPLSEQFQALMLAVTPEAGQAWTWYPIADTISSQFWSTSAPLTGPDGVVYVTLHVGEVESRAYAIGPGGRDTWRGTRNLGWRTVTAMGPDGTFYVAGAGAGVGDSGIWAYDPDGRERFLTWNDPWHRLGRIEHLAVDRSGRLLAAGSGRLHAFTAEGDHAWTRETDEPTVSAGIAVGPEGTIYIGTQTAPVNEDPVSGFLYAYDPDGGSRWVLAFDSVPCGIPVVDAEGTVYVVSRGSELGLQSEVVALEASGALRFRRAFDDELMPCGLNEDAWYVASPMLDAQGRLWFGSATDRLFVVTR